MLLFLPLRYVIVAFRRLMCKILGHRMQESNYLEAAKQGSSFTRLKQCARCRFIARERQDSIVIRL